MVLVRGARWLPSYTRLYRDRAFALDPLGDALETAIEETRLAYGTMLPCVVAKREVGLVDASEQAGRFQEAILAIQKTAGPRQS